MLLNSEILEKLKKQREEVDQKISDYHHAEVIAEEIVELIKESLSLFEKTDTVSQLKAAIFEVFAAKIVPTSSQIQEDGSYVYSVKSRFQKIYNFEDRELVQITPELVSQVIRTVDSVEIMGMGYEFWTLVDTIMKRKSS